MKRTPLLLTPLVILAIGCERPKPSQPPSAKPASVKPEPASVKPEPATLESEPAKAVKPEIRYYAFKG